ncbi:GNAT family N-acetyltransferase [Mariniplasma anaerobium]|uniref:N-acetyltransferase n=1 Tax=Mariniplasma anaerobium TaxID=2735436 RepID=A0A7U9TII4_9MOLU|nr:GNAT family N-acetyltransferase [Mariniplasma anaerobium]BCR35977.1 N-acetyltransferase [Mariniplasma anaerobium]
MKKKPFKHMPKVLFGEYMLRTLKTKDYRDLFEYGKDPEVTKFLNWGPMVLSIEAKRSIKEIFYPRVKNGLPVGYAIIDINKNKMIGTVDFHSVISDQNTAEIGYVIHKDYWGKGIMTQAVKELIKLGFTYLNYDKIIIKHLSKNIGSQRVIEKSGFKYIKKEPYTLKKINSIIEDDMLIYEITKEDYHGSKQS